jgi:hypothetical protein
MANPRLREETEQPPGVQGEGLDPYPTYRDGPQTPHRATGTKPTDVSLPKSQRTYWLPMFLALIVFALVVLVRLIWGGAEVASTSDGSVDAAGSGTPAIEAPADAPASSAVTNPETEGSFDEDIRPDTQTGPGDVGEAPGPVDVPGGATTTDPAAPAQ